MSPRSLCGVALLVCAAAASACDQCAKPGSGQPYNFQFSQPGVGNSAPVFSYGQPNFNGNPNSYTPQGGYSPVIPVGAASISPLTTPHFGVAGSGAFGPAGHSQCTDPNCRSCPPAGFGTSSACPGGCCNGQCAPNCTHPGGACPPGGCSDGTCGCAAHGAAAGAQSGLPVAAGSRVCPVDGRPLGQAGPPHSVVLNGQIVLVCSGQCANALRGYGAAGAYQPARFVPATAPAYGPIR